MDTRSLHTSPVPSLREPSLAGSRAGAHIPQATRSLLDSCWPVPWIRLFRAWNRLHGFKLASLYKEVEEVRMGFKAAVFNPLDHVFQFLTFQLRQECDGCAFDRGIACLDYF